jgi:hypothetical protein
MIFCQDSLFRLKKEETTRLPASGSKDASHTLAPAEEVATMSRFRPFAGLLVLFLACSPVAAKADRYAGADDLSARLDRLMDDAWKKANITPARPADDAEWLRRVYLDLAGRIPSVTEARAFLGDRRADRRTRLVESLLGGQRYPTYFASVWGALLLPETNINIRIQAPAFERWLRDWLASERGYDQMVRELLTTASSPGMARIPAPNNALAVFYLAKENKPEEIAGAASRLFLGVNLGCAQCHNHPFASWKRDQFWSFAAFFSDLQARGGGRDRRDFTRQPLPANSLTIPGTEKVVRAKYLDGKEPTFQPGSSGRRVLADWMTAADNPYFARAAVNRMWGRLFGNGFIEPLDEMVGNEVVPAHPAVLDELAAAFTKQNYDVRWLIRVITATKAYQLTSARSHASQDDPRQFARMALRGLSGEQLFDSLAQATGFRDEGAAPGRIALFGSGGPARIEFLAKFAASTDRAADAETSILQALTLMNGRVMTSATNVRRSETLQAVVDAPFLDVPGKIETLYLAALSRKPTAKELDRLTRYVGKGEGSDARGEALADVFWALLNSTEFSVNH